MILYKKYLLWIIVCNYSCLTFEQKIYNQNKHLKNTKFLKKILLLGLFQSLSLQNNLSFDNLWLNDNLYSCSGLKSGRNFLMDYDFQTINSTNQKCSWSINDNCQFETDLYNNNLGNFCQNINYNGNCNPNNCKITFNNYFIKNNELTNIPCQKSLSIDEWLKLNNDNYEIIKIKNFQKCENATIAGSCSGINYSQNSLFNGGFCHNKDKSINSCSLVNKKKEICTINKKNNHMIYENNNNNYFLQLKNDSLHFNGNWINKNFTFQKNNENIKYLINSQYNNNLFLNVSSSKKIFIENNNNFFSEISDFDNTNIFFKNNNFKWKVNEDKIIFSESNTMINGNINYQILNHLFVFFQNQDPAPILTPKILLDNSIGYIKYKLLNSYLSKILGIHNPINEYTWNQLKNIYELFINKPLDQYYNSILLNFFNINLTDIKDSILLNSFNINLTDIKDIEKFTINNQEITIKKSDIFKILDVLTIIFNNEQIASLDMIKTIGYVERNNLLKNHINTCLKNKSYNVKAVQELRKIEFPNVYNYLNNINVNHPYKNIIDKIKDNDYILSESTFLNYIYDDFLSFLTLYSKDHIESFIINNNVLLNYYKTQIIDNFNKISLNLIIVKDFNDEYFLKNNNYIILSNNNNINKLFSKNNINENFVDIINGKNINPYEFSWNVLRNKKTEIIIYNDLKDTIIQSLNHLQELFNNKGFTFFDNQLFSKLNKYSYQLIFNILNTYSSESKNNNINYILEIIDGLIVNKNSFSNEFLKDFVNSNSFTQNNIFDTIKNNINNLPSNIIDNFVFYLYNIHLQLNNQLTVNPNDKTYQLFFNNVKFFFHKINTIDWILFNKNYQNFFINIFQALDYYFNIYQRKILMYNSNLFFAMESLNFYSNYFIEKLIKNSLSFSEEKWFNLPVEKNFLNCKMYPVPQCIFFHDDNNLQFNLKDYKITAINSCDENNCFTNYQYESLSLKRNLFFSNSSINSTIHITNVNNIPIKKNLLCKDFSWELVEKVLIFSIVFLSIIIGEEIMRLFYSWGINCCCDTYSFYYNPLNRYKLYVNFHRNINSLAYTLVFLSMLITQNKIFNNCNKKDEVLNTITVVQFSLYLVLFLLHSMTFNKNIFGYRYISYTLNFFLLALNITSLVKLCLFGYNE